MIADPFALAALIAAIAAAAFWLDGRFGWARKVTPALIVIIVGALLSNLGVVPATSPVYDAIFGPVTSLAIVWLLLAVSIRDLRMAGPRMLGALAIGVAGTALGALLVAVVFSGSLPGELWKLAGVLTGTYSGGSLNFVAVGRAVDLPPSLFAAAAAADNLMTAVWIGATLLLPLWLARYDRQQPRTPRTRASDDLDVARAAAGPADPWETETAALDAAHTKRSRTEPGDTPPLMALDMTLLFAIGFALLWVSARLAAAVPAVPGVLWLTTCALVVAQLPPVQRLRGSLQLGNMALHVFFVLIGIGSRVAEIARVGPEVLYMTAIVVGVHGIVIYGVGRVLRLDVATVSVASQAAIGGPSTAMALAIAREWRGLILPGLAAGLLGYAIGNYLGLAVAYLVRGITG